MNRYKIPLVKSALLNEEEVRRRLADFVLKTEFFSMNRECKKYEEGFAKKQGRKYAVFVNSGSSANLILIQALLNIGKLKKGDRVGFSSVTWSTNVMPLIQLGLEPVAIDCEKDSLNISSETLHKHIKNISALFLTNVLGFCDDIKTIKEMCGAHNITFLEDNCESLGSVAYDTRLGNFGLASTFSFFLGHHLPTIEGGMVCTDDEELHHALLMARSHGWSRNLPDGRKAVLSKMHDVDDFYDLYTFYDLGYNVRPTEINGFLGNVQLEHWDEIVAAREKNFKEMHVALAENKKFLPLSFGHMDTVSAFAVPVICSNRQVFEDCRGRFEENSVETRPIISGDITNQPFYRKYVKRGADCPNAKFVHRNGFYFGNNPDLTEEEIERLKSFIQKA